MWPNTFNKKSATISGWQALGDFASVKQQLQKIRASTRISSSKKGAGDGGMYAGGARPLPPLPPACPQSSNKSVRFSLPGNRGPFLSGSEGSGSDQGYESDQSRVRKDSSWQISTPSCFLGAEETARAARVTEQAGELPS